MLIAAGFLIGFLLGLTGMGGGAVTTPFLILWLHMNPVLAIGTDLVFAGVTKIVGGYQHWRQENVAPKLVIWMALGSLPAAFIGARLILTNSQNRYVVELVLPRALGVTLLVVALTLLHRLVRTPIRQRQLVPVSPRPMTLVLIGSCGGLLVGLTSVGGGTIIMAMLFIFCSLPIQQMVGLDVMHGALLTSVAALTYASSGQVEWQTAGWLLLGSLPGVWLGARSTKRVNVRHIRLVLILIIFMAGLQLAFGEAWH